MKQPKDTYRKDLLEVIDSTVEAYNMLKEKLLEEEANEEQEE